MDEPEPDKAADLPDEPPEEKHTASLVSPHAQCERCGSPYVSALPYFSAGSGTGGHPIADDVYCRRCGYIGSPDYL